MDGTLSISTDVVQCIVDRDLTQAASVAIQSAIITEKDSLKLLVKFGDLIDTFLRRDDLSSIKIKEAVRETLSDIEALELLDRLILILEQSLESWDHQSQVYLVRCVQVTSMIIDGKFISWYVKSSGGSPTGFRVARLAAVVSKYRKLLHQDQHSWIRSGGEEGAKAEALVKSNQQPKHDGRIFFHSLVL